MKKCLNCKNSLKGDQRKFCSSQCRSKYRRENNKEKIKEKIL